MPTKKKTSKTKREVPKREIPQREAYPVYLPKGYNGPAFQMEDGRTLFVSRWLTPSQWAALWMERDGQKERFSSPDLPVVEDKMDARRLLFAYALKKNLYRVQ